MRYPPTERLDHRKGLRELRSVTVMLAGSDERGAIWYLADRARWRPTNPCRNGPAPQEYRTDDELGADIFLPPGEALAYGDGRPRRGVMYRPRILS